MSKHARSAAVLPVDGVEQATAEDRTFPAVDPSSGETLWQVPDAGPADVVTATTAARRALLETPWSTDVGLRTDTLRRFAAELGARADDLALLAATETGLPVSLRADHLDVPLARMLQGRADREPEVVAVITPSTSPLAVALEEVGRALVSGSTVVLKPAPESASVALEIGRIGIDVLPRGVLNVLTTRDVDVAIALTRDPRVTEVSFTGSAVAGERVQGSAERLGKRARIDVGGPSVVTVEDDDDLAAVVPPAAAALAANAGQGCRLPASILVPPHRYDEALDLAVEAMRSVVVGDPTDDDTRCGPLRSRVARDRVLRYLTLARSEGGRMALGGDVLDRPGWWVAPTVVGGLSPQSRLVREEVLGPVLMVVADETSGRA